MKDFSKHIIYSHQSIEEALLRLNSFSGKDELTLFVLNEQNILVGTVTDGDIRRGLLKAKSIEDRIEKIMFRNFRFLLKDRISPQQIAQFRQDEIYLLPIIDEYGRVLRVVNLNETKSLLPLEVVLMAGGRGERLKPLTNHTPKPLLKVGEKPILEHNIDRLITYGIDNFYISVRYLSDLITEYCKKFEVNINYIHEEVPLGTIGAVALIEQFHYDTVLVMNADLLTNIDLEDFYMSFLRQKADLSVAAIPYNVNIPYAVLETKDEQILSLHEKPTYTYHSNAGIYLIKNYLLEHIPKNQFYNATDFIDAMIKKGYKVCYYPILTYWLDIGKPEDFEKAQEDIKYLHL
ncbi:MAG: nucleotidyltransferase family protein [Thermoflexibacter sp.]